MVVTIHHGNENATISTLQRALVSLGHHLPRYGVDGQAGDETFDALNEFCRAHGLPEFDELMPALVVEIVVAFAALAGHAPPAIPPPNWPGDWLHDFRDCYPDKLGEQRNWHAITGITLHQTATCFTHSTEHARVARALERVSKIRAHFVVLRSGDASYNAPLNREVAHAHAFNRADVGIEIDGYFAGVEGDLRTFWKPESKPNRQPMGASRVQIAHARSICRHIVETVVVHGGEVRYIHAHRQTHRGKPSDPGELIWREVALWCKRELGLHDSARDYYVPHHRNRKPGGLGSKAGPGRPIPVEWDPSAAQIYSFKPDK